MFQLTSSLASPPSITMVPAASSCPCNLSPALPLDRKKITRATVAYAFKSAANMVISTKVTDGIVSGTPQTLLRFSSDALQYEQGKVGAVPDGGVSESPVSAMEYLTSILTSKVYDVAMETPLQHAVKMSAKLGTDVWLKREDVQPVRALLLLL